MTTTELDRQLHATVMKREAVKEAEARQKREQYEDEFYSNLGMGGSEMSKQELKKLIDSDRRLYYRTEELNDKLYIHYKGWRAIQNLEGWTGLKTLYAECNAFDRIQGLQNCRNLRSLFLQENCIKKIEGLENCHELWSINLSSNFIDRIEGLSHLRGLNSLSIAKNKIGHRGLEDLEHLVDTTLNTIDLQDNVIEDPDVVPEVLMRMPNLRVLYLKGNPCCKKIVNYRKSTTVYCEELRYLDDRPVFAEDRRAAEAFNRGGLEEERAERKRIREENNTKHEKNMRMFNEMIENARREKRERLAMRAEDKYTDETDPVESYERRCKRLQDQWKEDNAKDLKDDAKEYAERCLKAEKEGGSAPEASTESDEEVPSMVGKTARAAPETRSSEPEAVDTSDSKASSQEGASDTAGEQKPKVDNRKLVYEDIWDDKPAESQGAADPGSSSQATDEKTDNRKLVYDDIWDDVPQKSSIGQAPAPKPRADEAVSGGVFLPWAAGEGTVGMDAIAPSAATLQQRKATLQATLQASSVDSAATSTGKAPPVAVSAGPVAERRSVIAPSSFGELDELD